MKHSLRLYKKSIVNFYKFQDFFLDILKNELSGEIDIAEKQSETRYVDAMIFLNAILSKL